MLVSASSQGHPLSNVALWWELISAHRNVHHLVGVLHLGRSCNHLHLLNHRRSWCCTTTSMSIIFSFSRNSRNCSWAISTISWTVCTTGRERAPTSHDQTVHHFVGDWIWNSLHYLNGGPSTRVFDVAFAVAAATAEEAGTHTVSSLRVLGTDLMACGLCSTVAPLPCWSLGSFSAVMCSCDEPPTHLPGVPGTGVLWVLTGTHPCDAPIQAG